MGVYYENAANQSIMKYSVTSPYPTSTKDPVMWGLTSLYSGVNFYTITEGTGKSEVLRKIGPILFFSQRQNQYFSNLIP